MWVDTKTPYPLAFAGFLLPPPPLQKKKKYLPAQPWFPVAPKCGCADPQRLSDRLCSSKGRH